MARLSGMEGAPAWEKTTCALLAPEWCRAELLGSALQLPCPTWFANTGCDQVGRWY